MAIKEAMGHIRQVSAQRFANQRRNHGFSSFRSNKGPVNAENKPSQQTQPSDRHSLHPNPMNATATKSDPVAQSIGLNNSSPSATMSASPMQHINGPQFMPWQMMNAYTNAGNHAGHCYGPPGYGPQRSNHPNHQFQTGWYPNGLNHQFGQFW